MIRLDGHDRIEGALRGGVIALGNFDGFHAGHQAVVGRAVRHAKDEGRPAIVATFDPHPVRFFKPDVPPFRLTTLAQRLELFGAAGADAMLVLPFDATLAATTAEDFITELLLGRYGAAGVVTGADFTFGRGRGGDVVTLADHARRLGFFTEMVAPVDDTNDVVSSSRIRDALRSGDCATATRLLTRPFTVRNVVQHGDKNGRLLGFPTANLEMGNYLRPRYGIYAVTGRLPDGRVLKGAANLGIRPSFDPPKELLEPHFFDFAEDLYGQEIDVAFHAFIRPEAKYDGMDALMAQIAADCDAAKALLADI
ncbi:MULTISPECIES: bifunctional riboflavin kinase/FAD synthetase [unclassified Sphingopyxis]|uniref:bifunctional riboflavin kinase/FAD synthetase n=1 Tax=unclassified Sphingopyxis TaxID=2614943 RepID=UPI00072FAAC8|nr:MULTISPECIES: bifunctional riboflavin kinase/FAD synthetase [unclassified Sphingopyxis]KTE21568.1 bifunctional riboflavin kinase/FMN adenylyltransferase [Sphingopyxis sp. H057]KTE49565.1 bifunctional riboflavin kinase/FMN adenylyltransferase [Sphingopyxis sp. H073]KTE49778.1 bifunctional riboflavin kinase/FMN adenylyltransferase [Sphingopyxis sp. H071]KTE58191.1 bifunctional riboflavin kinase/FMN adenylyltransferase [Sphingopyxis sp. H107]KTE62661.1 bifunctional riboflavin kinase/FMN adenyl